MDLEEAHQRSDLAHIHQIVVVGERCRLPAAAVAAVVDILADSLLDEIPYSAARRGSSVEHLPLEHTDYLTQQKYWPSAAAVVAVVVSVAWPV